MKKVFVVVTFVLAATLVAMLLTKPQPQAHYDAVVALTQNVVDQETQGLEQLANSVDLPEVAQYGKDLAMNTAGFYLQSHLQVEDYYVVNVGLVKYNGMHIPVTLGILGSVYRLVDEEQVSRLLRDRVKR